MLMVESGAVFLGNALLDYAYYEEWVFPPITFLRFNLLHSLSGFYGRNDWHYYISQGLPLLLTAFLPLALYALFTSIRTFNPASPGFQLAATVVGVAGVYSLIAHKEVRFLYPLLPILHVLSAKNLQNLRWSSKTKKRALVGMVLLNIPIAYYAAFVHQRGVVDVIDRLRETRGDWSSVGFLMPCHSTPWRSSLGYPSAPEEIWALTCEPPVDLPTAERHGYLDEADQFYADPRKFVNAHIGGRGEGRKYAWPDRLVMFEQLVNDDSPSSLSGVISMRYEECWRGFNSHVHDDWRRKGDVLVYCSKKEEARPAEEQNAI
jgi:phosphatidylinositol glycan class B